MKLIMRKKYFLYLTTLLSVLFSSQITVLARDLPQPPLPQSSYFEQKRYQNNTQYPVCNWGEYIQQVQNKIKLNWHPMYDQNQSFQKQAVIIFSLEGKGQLLSYKIMNTSGDNSFDEQAINTITRVSPFAPFPAFCNEDKVDIKFTFRQNNYAYDQNNYAFQQNNYAYKQSGQNEQHYDDRAVYEAYLTRLDAIVKANWQPPKKCSDSSATVLFKINRAGQLLSYDVIEPSGNKSFDESAIAAVKKAAPFEPCPSSYNGDTLDIKFGFKTSKVGQCGDNLSLVYVLSHITQTILWIISLAMR